MNEKDDGGHGTDDVRDDTSENDDVRVWLVERTYSDDEQNLIILVYATSDGRRYFRKERALPSFTGSARQTFAGLDVSPDQLGTVADEETRERYATEADRIASEHDPSDPI
ncbi:hypothetical protein ACFFQF_09585 [Haladaptatus pallidirubidus]|uniref:DUF7967 domain-containing protein n=1 Tax=Haladaptatus pallidirubidus TaxID=1008152 RepID=A0AAV3UFF9_9EURY|nr:hypothetical protein [Haladaptatus pallidirubidus]